MLVLISKDSPGTPSSLEANAEALLKKTFSAEDVVKQLSESLDQNVDDQKSKSLLLDKLRQRLTEVHKLLNQKQLEAKQLNNDLQGLSLVEASLKKSEISKNTATVRSPEVGGIAVDSEYVVFIIDTSGSMKEIWGRVIKELENVIRIHPKLKGFQVLNDNGFHLFSSYEGRWIPDTPARREGTISLLKNWEAASSSSPVRGIEAALKRYARTTPNVSIYVFGDDYTGSSYDPVIASITNLNTNNINGKQYAKIYAVGFFSRYTTDRFTTLMREVTRLNGGVMLALPR